MPADANLSDNLRQMRPPGVLKGHIPALDGLRGLAVALVFLLHYHPDASLGNPVLRFFDHAADIGWAGVSLFFALSGFLITGILWDSLGRPHWWRNFYVRRSLRIFPLYYLVLVIVTIIAIAIGTPWNDTAKISIDFLYLTDIPWLWNQMFGFPFESSLVHFWSLAVEEQFYLIWPFLILAFARNRKGLMRVCIAVWIASTAFRFLAVGLNWSWLWPHHFLLSRAGELCVGAFLALGLRGTSINFQSIQRAAWWVFGGTLGVLVIITVFSSGLSLMDSPWATAGIAACSLFFTSMIVLCLGENWVRSFFEWSFLRWLGKISYGIYVYHLLLFESFEKLTDWLFPHASPLTRQLLLFLSGAIGTLLISTISFHIFEKKFLSLKDKLGNSSNVTPAVKEKREALAAE